MISFDQALQTVLSMVRSVGHEQVAIDESLNRILAEHVHSDIDMPPFDKSAMDGYACRRDDLGRELKIVETIAAGQVPQKSIGPGLCAKIMTGAMVPEGADCVVMKEYTENPTPHTMRFTGRGTAANICYRGEDVRCGQLVLPKGTRLEARHIAMLASVGCVLPRVACRPKVGIIATGNELVEPSQKPDVSQIRNSNSYQLAAQVIQAGATPHYYGIALDSEDAIDAVLKTAMAENDVVLVSGGVSMGEFDLVPAILEKNGVDLVFEQIAIKPGKPTVFGVSDQAVCFGLPGNPVSTFVLFELLVKPFLYGMMGHDYKPADIRLPLEKEIRRKRTERMSWLPVALTDNGTVEPVEYHGSAHIDALSNAYGIISVPAGVAQIQEGTLVHVRPL